MYHLSSVIRKIKNRKTAEYGLKMPNNLHVLLFRHWLSYLQQNDKKVLSIVLQYITQFLVIVAYKLYTVVLFNGRFN